MKNRLVIAIVLLSMALHCSSRIGFLSYMYQSRHEIAYTMGLIAEVPITMCNSDYDFGAKLIVQDDGERDEVPTSIHASEIILFIVDKRNLSTSFTAILLRSLSHKAYNETLSVLPRTGIFQPPRA